MTYSVKIQIEELRAELRNAIDGAERRQIEAELEIVHAELAVMLVKQLGPVDPEPPY